MALRLRVGQTEGRPLVWLDRDRLPGLPAGETAFTADGDEYVGRFVKVALNVARHRGSTPTTCTPYSVVGSAQAPASPGPTTTSRLRPRPTGGCCDRPATTPSLSSPRRGRRSGRSAIHWGFHIQSARETWLDDCAATDPRARCSCQLR